MLKKKRFLTSITLVAIILLIGAFGTYSVFKSNNQSKELLTSQSSNITLEIFTGQVFVIDPKTGQDQEATNGQVVTVGDSIHTDSAGRAQVVYSNGTVTRIDHSSNMTVAKADLNPQEITVNVTAGRVWSRVKKLLGQESYQTETGTVVAAVRGTSYGHGILADGKNKITTTKHTVSVNCRNDTQSGQVSQNMKLLLDCQTGSGSDVVPVESTDQDEWYQFNLEQDRLLDSRFGAATYDDEGEVQGASASASPSVKAIPKVKLPDTALNPAKTAAPAQTTTPQPVSPTNQSSTTTPTPTPTPTPVATPPPKAPPPPPPANPNLQIFKFPTNNLRQFVIVTPTPAPIQIN